MPSQPSNSMTGSAAEDELIQCQGQGKQTVGQRLHTLTRQVLGDLLQFILTQFSQGQTSQQTLEGLLPA